MAGYFPLTSDPNAGWTYTLGAVAPKPVTPIVTKVTGRPGVVNTQGVVTAPAAVGTDFNINPQPQSGSGPYGAVPGPIAYPTTPYAEATRIYPGLSTLTPAVGEQIASQVAGEFTPQEENTLWDIANRYGVASGMPGAQLWSNKFMGNVIDARQKRIQQGITNYQTMLNELSKMGVDPALAAEIAARNANMAAAPNPEEAAKALEAAYRNAAANPAGGTVKGIQPGSYGTGWYDTLLRGVTPSPAAGTVTPTTGTGGSVVNPFPEPQNPTTPGYGVASNSRGGYATSNDATMPPGTGAAWNNQGGFAMGGMTQDEYDMNYITTGADPLGLYTRNNYGGSSGASMWNDIMNDPSAGTGNTSYIAGGLPFEPNISNFAGTYDPYSWFGNSLITPQFGGQAPETTPMYEDEFDWLWNQATPTEQDPWAIYD